MEEQKVFLRESSGLVREISPWSSVMATFGLVTGGVPLLIISWLWLAPGISWPLAFTITLFPTLAMVSLYYVAGVSMPRAGGDYVFNARAAGPIVGFINYFALFVAFALSLGLYSYLGAQWFAYLFTGLGLYYNDPNLVDLGNFFASTEGSVVVGTLIMVMTSLMALRRTWTWTFSSVAGAISIVATLIMFAALAQIHPQQFYSALADFTNVSDPAFEVYNSSVTNGLTYVSDPVKYVYLGIPVVWYYFSWYNLPAAWSGEMRKPKLNVLYSTIVVVLMVYVYYVLFTQLNINAFGERFLTSWSYIDYNGINDTVYNSLSSIGTFTPFFALLVNHNVLLYVIMFVALWLPNFYSNPPLAVALTRYLFAWAFDRILPSWVADVNPKYAIPVKATAIVLALGFLGVVLYAYVPAISLVDVTVVFEIGYAVFAISVALMPYVRRQIYETAVPFKRRLLGVPVITWVGLFAFGFLVYTIYITLGNEVLLPINTETLASLGVIYGLGALIYAVSYFWNKRNGIDITQVFKYIPPE
ncbi:MAG: APC family permease [Thermoprotei archaeon]